MTTFTELGLSEKTLSAIAHLGYDHPTPVQEQAIPLILDGSDLIAGAKTGTGKTAAFALPCMDGLGHVQKNQGPNMLVVTPTRELALQIGSVCETIARSTHHRIATLVGGVSYGPQVKLLKQGVDILIATPGRLIDLMQQHEVRLSNVKILVLDEADRMLDMGFWPSVRKIAAEVPKGRQTLMFSATIDQLVEKSARTLLRNPASVSIAHRGETADTVDQYIIRVPQTAKAALLYAVLKEKGADRVIVFTRTRSRADATTRRLRRAGFSVDAIHSDRSQTQRARALRHFSEGRTSVLVATDVLARGIDVSEVDYVVNFDLPNQPEDYIHRIGRTGRAGEEGFSISFVSPEQEEWLRDIEKLTKNVIPELTIEGFDPGQVEEVTNVRVAKRATERITRRAAEEDSELANAVNENTKRQKRHNKKKASLTEPKPTRQKKSHLGQTPAAPPAPPAKPSTASPAKKKARKKMAGPPATSTPTKRRDGQKEIIDMRPGRAQRAAAAKKRRR